MVSLKKIAEALKARVFTHAEIAESAVIERLYAGDRMSEILNEASEGTLLISNLANPHLLRVAELMDAPAICLLNGTDPSGELVAAADKNMKLLMVSPADMSGTCRLLSQLPIRGAGLNRS